MNHTFTELTLSEDEMSFLRRALECAYDMENDTIYDEIPGAFVAPGETITIDREKAKEVRQAINEKIDVLFAAKSTCEKFGVKVK